MPRLKNLRTGILLYSKSNFQRNGKMVIQNLRLSRYCWKRMLVLSASFPVFGTLISLSLQNFKIIPPQKNNEIQINPTKKSYKPLIK